MYSRSNDKSKELSPALVACINDCHDKWLASRLPAYETGMFWDRAVSVGLYGRLCQHSAALKERAVRYMLSGLTDPLVHAPWVWASKLSDAAVDELVAIFVQARAQLLEQMMELRLAEDHDDDLPFDDPQWVQGWLDCLYQRDDLESIACLLRHHRKGRGALDDMLEVIDDNGRLWAASLPLFDEIVGDERLVRASRTAPGLWWTLPAVEVAF